LLLRVLLVLLVVVGVEILGRVVTPDLVEVLVGVQQAVQALLGGLVIHQANLQPVGTALQQ
jgi:hypothetical protein